MIKSFTSKIHLKQHSYSHMMIESESFIDHVTTFKKIIFDLKAMNIEHGKEDLELILLCSLLLLYVTFRYIILYGQEAFFLKLSS